MWPEKSKLWPVVLGLAALAVALGAGGFLYYRQQRNELRHEVNNGLSAIAGVKVANIVHWREDHLGDAAVIAKTPGLRRCFEPTGREQERRNLAEWLDGVLRLHDYSNIAIYDHIGNPVASAGPLHFLDDEERTSSQQVLRSGQPVLTSLHSHDNLPGHLLALAPVPGAADSGGQAPGFIVIVIDPFRFLFPHLRQWPASSASAETLLVRREGSEVLVLNDLRHEKDGAFRLRIPLDRTNEAAVMLAGGKEGVVEATDYRGVPVLAALRRVPGSRWVLIAKVDQEEVYRPLRRLAWIAGMIRAALALALGAIIAFGWRNAQLVWRRRQHQLEQERRALEGHFSLLTRYANDMILLLADDGKLLYANERAATAYGYTGEEFLNLTARQLRAPSALKSFEADWASVIEGDGRIFETVNVRKDGSTFPVEVSSRVIDKEGRKFRQSILRDITERRKAEVAAQLAVDRLRGITEATGDRVAALDLDWNFIAFNSAYQRAFEEAFGTRIAVGSNLLAALAHLPEEREKARKVWQRALSGERFTVTEEFGDGKWDRRYLEARFDTLLDKSEARIGAVSTTRDITESTRTNRELSRLNRALVAIRNCNQALVAATDENILIDTLCRILAGVGGYPLVWVGIAEQDEEKTVRPAAIAGRAAAYVESIGVTWSDEATGQGPAGTAIRTCLPIVYEEIANDPRFAPWRERALEHSLRSAIGLPLLHDGRPFGALTMYAADSGAFDVEERGLLDEFAADLSFGIGVLRARKAHERAEAAVSESEAKFRTLFESLADAVLIHHMGSRFVEVNQGACDQLSYSREELLNLSPFDINAPEYESSIPNRIEVLRQQGQSVFETVFVSKDGRRIPTEINSRLFEYQGRPAILTVARDLTKRKETEEALRSTQSLLARAQTVAALGNWEVNPIDLTGRLSEETSRILGIPAGFHATMQSMSSLIDPGDHDAVVAAINSVVKTAQPCAFEHRVIRPDGVQRFIRQHVEAVLDESGRPVKITGTMQDITDFKRLEAQFLQAQKLESVGRLAGGIAHDFNNLLTVINGYSDMLVKKTHSEDPLHEPLAEILAAGERAASLTQQLLIFSRRNVVQPDIVDLNGVIRDSQRLLGRLIGEDIELITRLDPHLPRIRADKNQMHQVIMNLVVNARDVMPNGGRLIVETVAGVFQAGIGDSANGDNAGSYVVLSVSDNGPGMDEATKARIFEPFFTTKGAGSGTGLGLSTVYGIVIQSGGKIWVDSEPGQGATFKLYFPVAIVTTAREEVKPAASKPVHGDETILLVEDQKEVRKLAHLSLKALGYRVLAASDGREALRLSEQHDGHIHLLATDVILPGMNGRELADRLLERRRDMKVLYLSGYTDTVLEPRGIHRDDRAFLSKPFTPQMLASKVRSVLNPKVVVLPD